MYTLYSLSTCCIKRNRMEGNRSADGDLLGRRPSRDLVHSQDRLTGQHIRNAHRLFEHADDCEQAFLPSSSCSFVLVGDAIEWNRRCNWIAD